MIGAGIVTYNPEIGLLERNIKMIIDQVDEVIIVDNASENKKELEKISQKYNVLVLYNDINQGIANALNRLMETFENMHYQWVLTLDQDTLCPENLITMLKRYAEENVGIISPQFINRNAERKKDKVLNDVEKVEWTITSASLTNVTAWRVVDGFDDDLFIDGVDTDFGIRLNKAGYFVIKVNTISISHKIGNSFVKTICGHQFLIQNHNAFRKYYIARNTIIVDKKNYGRRRLLLAYMKVFKQFLLVVFFEREKKQKIQAILQGVRDSEKYFRGQL